ncbi:hypothetical protein AJ85_17725 [Alkalihalobacillus alcalophilus ATCC 27647 = CGMCC 1.3604]|uniref:Uncharacterized protein n=1 Tax=Alkalihalobacillus alcalophilus ATCC 27647 = CGMCC 1.3604 TaxID=1218173 RepID=A0A094WEI7_ALKAL|nr:hypothetical protein [Alkalihalobacillus alcalophilus]KGA96174.1 hypothetical protein BALCAV_0217945 [Alkalihalobacillus alcalophilus ATCC 27647 = CGMCC 1.3604]MED1562781.1 hypothetical protein [Alkalihalobacillus alcalophilus]THG89447.1 hypothetical protein AJ85_17725 [Alkalihalobacillus alcalophilus ATCC 27647 = CGMCC 1.3604]
MNQTIQFEKGIRADLYIYELNRKLLNKKCSEVNVVELTNEAIEFYSSLELPLLKGVIYKIKTEVFKKELELFGIICEKRQRLDSSLFYYQLYYISFSKHENLHLQEIKLKQSQLKKYEIDRLVVNEFYNEGAKMNGCQ